MSPRHNRRLRDQADDEGRARRSLDSVEPAADGDWLVRTLAGSGTGKVYRCPGCDQEIPSGVPHVVAWQVDGDPGDRRHWHTPCWRSRQHRTPRLQRGRSAPKY
ncbi:hypothetical protein [Longispora albida]|uniref:hypothetical protein n=1 Tax=Longispora albida TaxID=203523 RepID=UPI0003720E4A|nr:hypothetical protein [Longispora albida]